MMDASIPEVLILYPSPHGDEMKYDCFLKDYKGDMYPSPHGDEKKCKPNDIDPWPCPYPSPHGDEMKSA